MVRDLQFLQFTERVTQIRLGSLQAGLFAAGARSRRFGHPRSERTYFCAARYSINAARSSALLNPA